MVAIVHRCVQVLPEYSSQKTILGILEKDMVQLAVKRLSSTIDVQRDGRWYTHADLDAMLEDVAKANHEG